MENYRSQSCRDGRMQIQSYHGGGQPPSGPPNSMHDLRSYSTSYASSVQIQPQNQNQNQMGKELKIKKYGSVGSTSKSNWGFNDPELQRKKRVVGYKAYAVEGKMKGSFRKSFRWIKNTCTQVVHGWW